MTTAVAETRDIGRREGYDAIAAALGSRARRDEPLSRHTSFRVGGPADLLVLPSTDDEVARTLALARRHALPLLVLGAGSNLLVRDGGFRGVVVKLMKNFSGELEPPAGEAAADGRGRIRARAGDTVARLAFRAAERGLTGIEFAVGIPGTIGGGVATNAGAHGGEIGARVEWIAGIAADGASARLSRDDLAFRYRAVRLPAGFAVTQVLLALDPDDPERVLATTRGYMADRRAKQPLSFPSAGCYFKNPPGGHAGRMIEEAGLKGLRVGGMEVSRKHANFIVNVGGGTARDALRLVEDVRERVERAHGVRIETEVMVVGEDPS